ncbi:MAG: hypothetical protein DPW09_02195 [Anaerolineae bacterium]|nr:hypothetical protein [Anaerolineae bacterium]
MRNSGFRVTGVVPAIIGLIFLAVGITIWAFWTANPAPAPGASSANLTDITSRPNPLAADDSAVWPTLTGLATFGNQIKLLSFEAPSLPLMPGNTVNTTLFWQTQPLTTPLNVFLHVLDPNANLIAQTDVSLAEPGCAQMGRFSPDIVITCAAIQLPDSLPDGQYQLVAGIYEAGSGQRLITPTGEGEFSLTTLEIHAGTENLSACPVTPPNGSTPPGEQPSPEYYGHDQLWTVLWPDGKVIFEAGGPGQVNPDGSAEMKWGWWRGVAGWLTIEGRRLDASAPPLRANIPEGYGETGFQASGLIFSTPGCWEVTGRVGQTELTFVTLVVINEREK